jgi:ornithine decarboxylase
MAPSALTPNDLYQLSYETFNCTDPIDHGGLKAKQLICDALKNRVEAIDHDVCEVGDEDAFFVADLGEVYRQHLRWKTHLGRVKPHYGQSPRFYLVFPHTHPTLC